MLKASQKIRHGASFLVQNPVPVLLSPRRREKKKTEQMDKIIIKTNRGVKEKGVVARGKCHF